MTFKKGYSPWNKGLTKETDKRLINYAKNLGRYAHKGAVPWNKGKSVMVGEKNPFYGKHHSEETKRELSGKARERLKNPENNPFYGKHHTKETREMLSKSKRGNIPWNKGKTSKDDPRILAGEQNPFYRKKQSEEAKEKISRKNKGQVAWNRGLTKETDVRVAGYSASIKELWQDSEFIQKVMDGRKAKPNKSELQLEPLIQTARPNEFKYNGGFELGISLGGKIPDWVNCNGKKEVIEYFGQVWHSPLFTFREGLPYHQTYKGTIEHYKKYGWKCLIIWEPELKEPKKIVEKIKNF